jgi:hypothetical protein
MDHQCIGRPLPLALAAAFLAIAPSAHAIQYGAVDTANHYSNVGSVVVTQPIVNLPPWDQIPVPWIGGSGVLIHPRVMLLAGHTVEELELGTAAGNPTDVVRVSFGPDAYDPTTWFEIESFLKHPKYRSPKGAADNIYDVGVLFLKDRVLHVAPAELPDPLLLDSLRNEGALGRTASRTPFTVIGYGLSDAAAIRADGLRREGTLGLLSLRNTRVDFFGPLHGYSGTLQGDSGGPIFWNHPTTGAEQLVATATGWDRIEPHMRIDLPEVLAFLHGAMLFADGWSANPAVLSSAAVPEPGTILPLLLSLLFLIGRTRQMRRLAINRRGTSAAAVVLLGTVSLAAAQQPAVISTGGGPAGVSDSSRGWSFSLAQPVTVTHLGILDLDYSAFPGVPPSFVGLLFDHDVAIWNNDTREMLAMTTIPAGAESLKIGHFRYEPIAPLQLIAGQRYVIGKQGPVDSSTAWTSGDFIVSANIGNVATDPLITIHEGRFRAEGILGFPAETATTPFFGPNFLFVGPSSLPGDFNADNVVNGADYVLWRKTGGSQAGYNDWRANFGALSPGAAAVALPPTNPAVPEPASTLLLLAAAMGLFVIPHRSRGGQNALMKSLRQSARLDPCPRAPRSLTIHQRPLIRQVRTALPVRALEDGQSCPSCRPVEHWSFDF